MSARTHRHLELLALAKPLHRYARGLQADVNDSFLLVHRTLSKAFAEGSQSLRPAAGLGASLEADLQRDFRSADA